MTDLYANHGRDSRASPIPLSRGMAGSELSWLEARLETRIDKVNSFIMNFMGRGSHQTSTWCDRQKLEHMLVPAGWSKLVARASN
ncbi:hypothetical protein F441_08143 [Phytophthora nicotianae CJ01A1]|uniref:Uncharacterized protein n=4 Tax=Phytophthora nicotianae TaxID=4792 RepID=V9F969_PHYNI|nr:hypothetical protein F443_08169 [Phytophthora nicotianae P1569]ETK87587.1 hypothetical protein L915_07993 [Phytophthora nicotianae]ETP17452.1 hypothetical protein F441_08143 [Phytophthora nicotianae CJ01A1]ETL41035.1 hypothetical protein L916_07916 [Phytophthora nicotianae]ETL94163.1 hypothetical protein L917_07815 [Phytophthora nicotianae]